MREVAPIAAPLDIDIDMIWHGKQPPFGNAGLRQ